MGGDGLIPVGAAVETPYAAAKTSVWWDIENCQLPRGCDAHAIAQNINAALMKMSYHGPVTISAYGDTNGFPSSVKRALSCTGIGLNHVPAGVKDASDKKILVDMLFWAVDNPAPANYMLISGDRDFSNAIHQLWMRRYNILLAQPFKSSPALAAAATNVWLWTSLAAGGSPRELAFGRGDFCGPMDKGDVRPAFSFLPSSSGVSKSVCVSKTRTALCGVVMDCYLKIKNVRAVQLPVDNFSDRIAKTILLRTVEEKIQGMGPRIQ